DSARTGPGSSDDGRRADPSADGVDDPIATATASRIRCMAGTGTRPWL
ncbi:MAG: hypothetical protein AVDCRST_MAG59-3570, partial [uncultured Thermomicrobiales bacterium]